MKRTLGNVAAALSHAGRFGGWLKNVLFLAGSVALVAGAVIARARDNVNVSAISALLAVGMCSSIITYLITRQLLVKSEREVVRKAIVAGSHFQTLDVETDYVFLDGRIPDAYYVERRLRALVPSVDTYVTTLMYTGSPEELLCQVISGGRIRRELPQSPLNFRRFEIDLECVLDENDEHTVKEVCRIGGRGSPPAPFLFYSVSQPTRKLSLRVRFAENALPMRVFRLETVATQFPHGTSREEAVRLDHAGVAETCFDHPMVGWIYALKWEWGD